MKPRETNLVQARKRAGLTQGELAQRLDVSQSQISKWESDPEEYLIPRLAKRIAVELGCDWLQLIENEEDNAPPTPVNFGDPYRRMDSNIGLLLDYVSSWQDQPALTDLRDDLPLVEELRVTIHKFARKPIIAVTGIFDSGKSTLLNTLMGRDILPTRYQPETRLPAYVMHASHRPSWMQASETVLIVSDLGLVKSIHEEDQNKLYKEKKVLVSGNAQTLKEFGSHSGKYLDNKDAKGALVFVNAPILKTCTFLDLPGYDESKRDGIIAGSAVGGADALMYVSPAAGFMKASDFQRFAHILRSLPTCENFSEDSEDFPTLGNVFLVASHAHRWISSSKLKGIHRGAAKRCIRDLGGGTLRDLAKRTDREINEDSIEKRIFPFWREWPERNEALLGALESFLSTHMPKLWQEEARKSVEDFRKKGKQRVSKCIDQWKDSLQKMGEMRAAYHKMQKQEPERKQSFADSLKKLKRKATNYRRKMRAEFISYYDKRMQPDSLSNEIKKRRYKSRKDAKESIGNYVVDTVQSKLDGLCHKYGLLISKDLEHELGEVLPDSFGTFEKPGILQSFDIKGTFLGALTGLGTLGALGIWASTFGPLGGYILVAKTVSVLSALGISTGGTAAAISFVSSIGGPIVLALGLALLTGLAVWRIFGDSWELSLAKKLRKVFEERDAKSTWIKMVDDFWTQTIEGIVEGYEVLEDEWQAELEKIRKIVDNPGESRKEIEEKITLSERALDFFGGIPWRVET